MQKLFKKGEIMEKQNNKANWDLIAKYYSDECNQQEIDELMIWVNQNKENKLLFNEVKNDLELINLNKSMNKVNVDSAWEKVKNRILEDDEQLIAEVSKESTQVRKLNFTTVLKYAAIVLVVLGIGFTATRVISNLNNTKIYADNQEQGKEVILPDGTKVYLNSDSYLTFPKKFAAAERRVTLKGEAFFDVTKNKEKPFIIESHSAEVKVLGTSFNVNAKLPNNEIQVYVQTGLVQLARKNNHTNKILINPGDLGTLTDQSVEKTKNTNVNIISWKTKEIIFENDNLKDVLNTLNKTYNVNIYTENTDITNLSYTSTFKDQKIDSILNVICLTLDLKTVKTDKGIELVKQI